MNLISLFKFLSVHPQYIRSTMTMRLCIFWKLFCVFSHNFHFFAKFLFYFFAQFSFYFFAKFSHYFFAKCLHYFFRIFLRNFRIFYFAKISNFFASKRKAKKCKTFREKCEILPKRFSFLLETLSTILKNIHFYF